MDRGPMYLWNNWETQILVLLSLSLQFGLLLLAGIRRREAHLVPRLFLWLVYQLADSTATYALGTLAIGSRTREHQLVAFWAPFLLLHLGGPDNITAYALQDNQLWWRHLQTLVVQVLGVVYVLYKHIAGNGLLVMLAAILMSVMGSVKYGERTWALRRGNISSIRSYVENEQPAKHNHSHREDHFLLNEEEKLLRDAHSQFHICKRAIVDSSVSSVGDDSDDQHNKTSGPDETPWQLWMMMEMELSLLYDILYTKAAVIHTWHGYFVRALSPITVVASLLLFHFSGKDGHSRFDVVVTYVLLAGALFLEATSLLNALGSTWTFAYLYATQWIWLRHTFLCNGRWDRLRRVVLSLCRLVNATRIRSRYSSSSRRWSGTMGQHNMLRQCTRWERSRPLLSRLANFLGRDEWTIDIPEDFKTEVYHFIDKIIKKGRVSTLGLIRKTWGLEALKRLELDTVIDDRYLGAELQEAIIIWHIGTDIFLARRWRGTGEGVSHRVDKIRAISNYMMFLMVKRPYMLPGLPQNKLYDRTYHSLTRDWSSVNAQVGSYGRINHICTSIRELFGLLRDDPVSNPRLQQRETLADVLFDKPRPVKMDIENTRVVYAIQLADKLVDMEEKNPLDVLLEVWMDILVYTANRCSRESHAAKLNNGGEFTTSLWLMTEHLNEAYLAPRWTSTVIEQ